MRPKWSALLLSVWHAKTLQNVLLKMETTRLLAWRNCWVSLIEAIPVKSWSSNYLPNQSGSESTHQAARTQEFVFDWNCTKELTNSKTFLSDYINYWHIILYIWPSAIYRAFVKRSSMVSWCPLESRALIADQLQFSYCCHLVRNHGFSTSVACLYFPFSTLSLSFVTRLPPHIHVMFLLKQTASHLLLH